MQAIKNLKPGGTFVQVGTFQNTNISIPSDVVMTKELTFKSINCKVSGIVNFSKLNRQKNVVNEIFNEEEAAVLFDNVFEGKVPVRGPI